MSMVDTCWKCRRAHYVAANTAACAWCGDPVDSIRSPVGGRYCSHGCYANVHALCLQAVAEVHRAIRKGLLPKIGKDTVCVDCGKPARHYEHRDYSKPLDVVPVCAGCNRKRGPADILLPWRASYRADGTRPEIKQS